MRTAALLSWGAIFAACGLAAVGNASCAQTPVNVPVRTFERAQKIDVVCMRVFDPATGAPEPPRPVVQAQCAPVPPNTDGSSLPYHLYALVTQTTRGEVAVVDLTAGTVVDEDRQTPGINFLPVGALPTDIGVTPDGQMSFVAAAEPNKPAIYAIRNDNILGDSQVGLPVPPTPATLASWPACALPQAPGAIAIIPHPATPGVDGGAATPPSYEVVVVLPGDRGASAKVVTLDPAPFLRGAGLDRSAGATVLPGSLADCAVAVTSAIELVDAAAVPKTFAAGPAWDDGIKYQGVPPAGGLGPPIAPPASCAAPSPAGDAGSAGDAGVSDAGTGDAATPDSGVESFDLGPLEPPRATVAARDNQILYLADDALPLIHVIDLSLPASPRELSPLLLTSVNDPTRRVAVKDIAVSPTTRDYKRFLYGLDKKDGSILVFDITDPQTSSHVPLTRPHAELNPFQQPDRIAFSVPVAAISFARHDFPLVRDVYRPLPAAKTGLLCNPNPGIGQDQGPFSDPGGYYRNNVANTDEVGILGPSRLRGVFAFATLSNGQVVTIDVDDWDAPCRRPVDMTGPTSSIALGEPTSPTGPYEAPVAGAAVTGEAFFPVSEPNRPRSFFLLKNDVTAGLHVPNLPGIPQVLVNNAPLPTVGPGSENNPLLLPTLSHTADPSGTPLTLPPGAQTPGVRLAWEDPQVHIDQDWTVTYEGVVPGFDGLAATVASTDGYFTLSLSSPSGLFCRRGVEDFRLGTERAKAALSAMSATTPPIPPPALLDRRVADYVQLTDEILPNTDPYWIEPNECWDASLAPGVARANACSTTYGPATAQSLQRDFPILEAYEDHLVVGRFGYPPDAVASTSTRQVVSSDAGNAAFLKLMRCCFHNQIHFNVRAGGEWVAVGTSVGYLHHVTRDQSGACVQSCSDRESLLNSRSMAVPRPPSGPVDIERNSPLAMRNPMFSYATWSGLSGVPARDVVWKFSSTGQFTPLTVNIAATTTSVSPQSMLFIDSLGQLAVVDGASQGLVLIDLNTVTFAHAPYF